MTTQEDGIPSQSTGVEKSPSPRHCKVYKCGHHICPDHGICADKECSMLCGVYLHSLLLNPFERYQPLLLMQNVGIVFCSVSCFCLIKIEAVTSDIVKTQRAELLKKNKGQLKKEV
jgi:hypothetical protein